MEDTNVTPNAAEVVPAPEQIDLPAPDGKKKKKKMSLTIKFLIGLVAGIILGLILGQKASAIAFIGNIFMNMLKMCMYPMVLFSIITAIAKVADVRRLKKVGGMFVLWVIVGSGIAGIFGIIAMYIIKPGAGLHWVADAAATTTVAETASSAGSTLISNIVNWVPSNPFASLAEGALIQIVFFAVFFGVVLALLKDRQPTAKLALDVIDGLDSVILGMINGVLQVAPFGICAMVANMVGTTGFQTLQAVGGFMIAYYIAIVAFFFLFLMAVIRFGCGLKVGRYIKNVTPVILTALSTLSSAGTIPVTNRASKENLGIPSDIADLLVAPAATINMNGAAVEQVAYILFASFIYDKPLTLPNLLLSVVLCVVMSIGAAGVPGGGVVMGTLAMSIMGFPQDIVVIIAGVYTIMDLGATVLNILGDTVGMTYISHRIGELNEDIYYADNAF